MLLFATIGSGKELKKIYSDEYLIIVDDPITSFDNENKIGIYGYLRSKMKQIHLGNPSSRIILLTHDYEVAYNLDKINNDVFAELEIKSQPKGYRLVDFNISDLNIGKGSNQYAVMLRNVFMFANESDDNVGDYAIGNMIRRMLEMFSSFEYNTSFEKLNYRCDATELYELLNNYMFRIIANNESHSMIHAYAYDEVDRFEVFSHKEKVIAAKLSLILIKELNDKHIKAYLGDDYTIIEKWEEDYSDLIKEK